LAESAEIKQRIEVRINQGEFLDSLLRISRGDSSKVQTQFVAELSKITATIRDLLDANGLVRRLAYRPGEFWPQQKGTTVAFIDGGVANIDIPSAAPIGIRVASYIVRPGDETENREKFNIELALVDDLFSPSGDFFEDDFDDIAKLRDVARMTLEIASAFRIAKSKRADRILLHGPLINPVAPYGLHGFPPFGLQGCRAILDDDAWDGSDDEKHFIPTYKHALESIRKTKVPVFGVVERSISKFPTVTNQIITDLQHKGVLKDKDAKEIGEYLRAYGLNDSRLFDVMLSEGEYVEPVVVDRQLPKSKWPENWSKYIETYPKTLTTYLKPSETVLPFRVEAFEDTADYTGTLDLIFHTSRLLPSYGFPVGLDIVDKFAKVPSWMSRSIKGQHQVVLLKKALASGDPKAVAFAKRVLTAKGRDWLFRPSS